MELGEALRFSSLARILVDSSAVAPRVIHGHPEFPPADRRAVRRVPVRLRARRPLRTTRSPRRRAECAWLLGAVDQAVDSYARLLSDPDDRRTAQTALIEILRLLESHSDGDRSFEIAYSSLRARIENLLGEVA